MGALGAAIARVADKGGERDTAQAGDLFCRRRHLQADLPVPGVITQRNGATVRVTDAALGADQQDFSAGEFVGIPAHTGVLGHTEQVAAGGFEQHLRGERQRALRPGSVGFHRIELFILRRKNGVDGHCRILPVNRVQRTAGDIFMEVVLHYRTTFL